MIDPFEMKSVQSNLEDNFGSEFADQLGELFKREHVITPPPEPIPDYLYGMEQAMMECSNFDCNYEPRPEPSLQQRIEWVESDIKYDKESERRTYNDDRQRENFGQRFRIVTHFDTNTTRHVYVRDDEEVGDNEGRGYKKVPDPEKELVLANRLALYRYLQQRGAILIDDTGLSQTGRRIDPERGYVMLPEVVESEAFYDLEDEIRSSWPFNYKELLLKKLVAEREGLEFDLEDSRLDPKKLREVVDYLATDERFMDMFAKGEELLIARREKRRANPEDEPLPVPPRKEPDYRPPDTEIYEKLHIPNEIQTTTTQSPTTSAVVTISLPDGKIIKMPLTLPKTP